MDTRRFTVNLVLFSLGFVALVHTVLAFIFNTGLGLISVGIEVIVLILLVVVNI